MKVTTRDVIILAIFSTLVALGCRWWLESLGRSAPSALDSRPEPPAAGRGRGGQAAGFATSVAPGTIPAEDQVILDRKLFTPLVTAPVAVAHHAGPTTPVNLPPVTVPPMPVPSVIVPPLSGANVRRAPPPGFFTGPRRPPTPPLPPVKAPPLALTGLLRLPGGTRVTIENTELEESRTTGLGQEVFGWRVVLVDISGLRVLLRPVQPGPAKGVELRLGQKAKITNLIGESARGGPGGRGGPAPGPPGKGGGEEPDEEPDEQG
jgi:hypothetical protein